MKKYLLIFITFIVLTGSSCKKKTENYITETETSEILLNKKIDSNFLTGQWTYNISAGTKTVFRYSHTYENKTPGLVDGFTDYTFAFAIDLTPSQTSFVLIDNDLKQAQAFYSYFTGDGSSRWLLLTQGKITGTKINSTTWNIVIHISSGPFPDINKNFIIQ